MIYLHEIPKKFGVYKLTNKFNSKIYIGKSNNLYQRMIDHKKAKGSQRLYYSIRKHGWNNFEVEILAEFDQVDNLELLALETAFIEFYNSLNKQIGYNICLFASDSTGIKRSLEQIENHRQKLLGKKHSEEHKQKIRLSLMGKVCSSETREKIAAPQRGSLNHMARKIIQINKLTSQTIKVWNTLKEATISVGLKNPYSLILSAKNPKKSAAGFYWKYTD